MAALELALELLIIASTEPREALQSIRDMSVVSNHSN